MDDPIEPPPLSQPERALIAAERVVRGGRASSDDVYDMAATCLAQRADLVVMKRVLDTTQHELDLADCALNMEGIGACSEETYLWETAADDVAKRQMDGYRPVDVDGARWAWVHDDIASGAVPLEPTYLTPDEVRVLGLT